MPNLLLCWLFRQSRKKHKSFWTKFCRNVLGCLFLLYLDKEFFKKFFALDSLFKRQCPTWWNIPVPPLPAWRSQSSKRKQTLKTLLRNVGKNDLFKKSEKTDPRRHSAKGETTFASCRPKLYLLFAFVCRIAVRLADCQGGSGELVSVATAPRHPGKATFGKRS